ncbi:MAG: nucleotide-binding protein [Terriglobia bacterium]
MPAQMVFIAHGHDSAALRDLELLLQSVGLHPIILSKQDCLGKTIIECFEFYAAQCVYAFAILTPDDKQAQDLEGRDKWRARQNVLMEAGWFMGRLGRERVALLHKGDVELPSDLLGVIYLPFRQSIYEVAEQIKQRLRGQRLLNAGVA